MILRDLDEFKQNGFEVVLRDVLQVLPGIIDMLQQTGFIMLPHMPQDACNMRSIHGFIRMYGIGVNPIIQVG